jgi:small nuclear ribonucleoprotein (snRNP)-like protein
MPAAFGRAGRFCKPARLAGLGGRTDFVHPLRLPIAAVLDGSLASDRNGGDRAACFTTRPPPHRSSQNRRRIAGTVTVTVTLPPMLQQLVGRDVVVDVASQYVYLGRLTGGDASFLVLEDADVHDLRDTATTRDEYVLAARRHGVAPNRTRVSVRTGDVVSLSALDDVIA